MSANYIPHRQSYTQTLVYMKDMRNTHIMLQKTRTPSYVHVSVLKRTCYASCMYTYKRQNSSIAADHT